MVILISLLAVDVGSIIGNMDMDRFQEVLFLLFLYNSEILQVKLFSESHFCFRNYKLKTELRVYLPVSESPKHFSKKSTLFSDSRRVWSCAPCGSHKAEEQTEV